MLQEMPVMSGGGGGGMTPSVETLNISSNSGVMSNIEPNCVICIGNYYFYYLGYISNGVLTTLSNGNGEHGYVDSYNENTKTISWRKSDTRSDIIRVVNYT